MPVHRWAGLDVRVAACDVGQGFAAGRPRPFRGRAAQGSGDDSGLRRARCNRADDFSRLGGRNRSPHSPRGDETSGDITARFGAVIVGYFPGRDARKIQCPAHFAVCEDDTLAPPGPTLRHGRKAPKAEVRMQPGGHFDIYVGDAFERNVSEQLDFLARHVPTAVNGT